MAYDRIELEKVSFNLVISINLYGKEKRMLLGKIRGIFEYKIEDKFKILNGIKFCAVFRKLSENFRQFSC